MDVDPCKICGQGKEGEKLLQCCEISCTMVAHPGCLPARAKQGTRVSLREWRCPGCWAKREAALHQKTQFKTSDGLVKREGGRLKEGPVTKAEGGSKPAPDGLCAAKGPLQKAETEVCKERQRKGKKRVQEVDSDSRGSACPPGRSKRVKGLADLYPPDIVCSVCNSPDGEDCMLLCETRGCRGTSHTFCCTPPLKAVPEGSWFCAQCTWKRGSVNVEKEKGSGSGSKRASRQGKDTGQRKKSRVAMQAVKGRQEEEELDAADSDSGPSVHPDAECDICHNPERGDVMLLCSGPACESKQHTFCCIPPLEDVPGGDWFCPECAGERGVEGKVVKGLVDDGARCLFHHKGRRGKILNQCGNSRAKGQRTCQFHVEYQRAAAEKAAKKKGLGTPGEIEDKSNPVTDRLGVEAGEKPGGQPRGNLRELESDGSEMRQSEREEREDSPSRASSVHPDAECDVCGSPEDDDVMLLCSTHGCEGRQHTFCCRPKLEEVPSGDWFCPECKKTKGGGNKGATEKAVFAAVAERVRDGVRCTVCSYGGGALRQCVAARQEGYLRCAYHREQKWRQKERNLKRKAEGPSQGGADQEVGKEPDTKKEEGAMGHITKQKQGSKGKAGYQFYTLVDDGCRCTAYADKQEGKVRNQCRRDRAPGHRYCQHHVDLKLKVRARWVEKQQQLTPSGAGSKFPMKKEASNRGGARGGAKKKVGKRGVLSGKERDGGGFGGRVRAKASKEGAQGPGLWKSRADSRQGPHIRAATGDGGEAENPSATSLLRKRDARTPGEDQGPLAGSPESCATKVKAGRLSMTPSEVGLPFDPVKAYLLEEAAVEDLTGPGLASPNQGLASANRGLGSPTARLGECASQGGNIAQSEKPEQGLKKDPPIRIAFAGEQLSWQTCKTTLLMNLNRAAAEGGTSGEAGKRALFGEAAERMQSADAEKKAALERAEKRAPLEEAGERSREAEKRAPLGEAEASMLLRDAGQALLRKIIAEEVQRLMGLQPQPAESQRLATKQSAGEGVRVLGQFETRETLKEVSSEENVHSNEEALEERSDEKRLTGNPSDKRAEQERASPSRTELISGGQSELEQISATLVTNGPAGGAQASGGVAETSGTSGVPVGGLLTGAGGRECREQLEGETARGKQAAKTPADGDERSGGVDVDASEAADQPSPVFETTPGRSPSGFVSSQQQAEVSVHFEQDGASQQDMAPGAPPPSPSMEHTAPDGQSYHVNKTTRQVVREKPMEPLAPAEKREPPHGDKEYTDNGRNDNSGTGASTRTVPEELGAAGEAQAAMPGAPIGGPSAPFPFRPSLAAPPPSPLAPFGDSSSTPSAAASPALPSSAAVLLILEPAGTDVQPSEGRPQKEVPMNAISGNPVEAPPPPEEEVHACTWPGCTRVFPTLLACSGHISSHKPGASEAAAKAGTGRLEQQESQAAAALVGEESHEKVRRTEPVVEVQLSGAVGPHHHPVRLLPSPEKAAPPSAQPGALLPSKTPLSCKPDAPSLLQNPGSRESSDPDESIPSKPSALTAPEDACKNRTGLGEQKPQLTTSPPPFLEALRLEPESSSEGGRLAACIQSEVPPPNSGVIAQAAGSGSGFESKEVSRASNARPRPKADWSQLFKKPKLNLHSSR